MSFPQNLGSTYRPLRTMCRRAGVPEVTWHALRHTYATLLVEAGVSLHDVQRLLGHSSLAMTGKYLHGDVESARAGVERALG